MHSQRLGLGNARENVAAPDLDQDQDWVGGQVSGVIIRAVRRAFLVFS